MKTLLTNFALFGKANISLKVSGSNLLTSQKCLKLGGDTAQLMSSCSESESGGRHRGSNKFWAP